jgi:predicted NBD/HSP70 family sugar kinase
MLGLERAQGSMKTADPELMRAINRFHVIDVLRREGPIARVGIVERTELSPATVSAITGGLIEQGVLNVLRVEPNEGGMRGRPRVLLDLNGRAFHVAGVKLAAHRIGVAVTDFKGDPLGSLVLPVRIARQPPDVIADLVEDGVRQCVADAGLSMDAISGVGVGLPGVIDAVANISHWSPILGPSPVPFAALLERRTGLRTWIENDANLAALAEHWFGQGRDLSSFAVVTVEDTIGMALLLDGRLYRGAHGVGAELGHVTLDPDGPPCRCGQRGCLDAYASDDAIIRQAREAGCIEAGNMLKAHQLIGRLTERALAGDTVLAAIFEAAGRKLGLAIANLINMLNPPRIIVSGEGLRAAALLTTPLLEEVNRHALPVLREATEIVFHPWPDEMWARGAASIVLRQIYESPWRNDSV